MGIKIGYAYIEDIEMIKLKCLNPDCNYVYQVTPAELEDNPQYHDKCLICGSRLKVDNVEEIVEKGLYERANEYLNEWIKTLGLEGALELVERHKEEAIGRIYMELLKKRGIIK
jgi:hypothetical protein